MYNIAEVRMNWRSQISIFLIFGSYSWYGCVWDYYFGKDFGLLFSSFLQANEKARICNFIYKDKKSTSCRRELESWAFSTDLFLWRIKDQPY